jgi:threonyl-tRNA synthetase
MEITLKDGSKKSFATEIAAAGVAGAISDGLLRAAVAAKINGELVDLSRVIKNDCALEIITLKDDEGRDIYRHTAAHILAQAVKSVYPTAKLGIGPATKNGYYYDFDFKTPITQEDLAAIEAEMQRIIKADFKIERLELNKKKALSLVAASEEPYKLELLNGLPADAVISFYKQGDFADMCLGPHLPSTGRLKSFKLTSIAGAYFKGDEKNKMLTRIYGCAFEKKSELDEYLLKLEEAKKHDHNKLGRELSLFMTEENIGQGLPLLMPKGAKILQILQRFVEDEEERRGYLFTKTPLMSKHNLFKISGHWYHYKDKMFVVGDGDESKNEEILALRPMTCPFQFMIYKNGIKSYRDLPVRFNETAVLFRAEASGEMHGLTRVRQFTLSDGHILCTPEQLEAEFAGCVDLVYYILDCLGLREEVTFRFSKWDPDNKEKYIDNPDAWETTQLLMKAIIDKLGIKYYEAKGEAAFYGPKLDIQSTNVYGKEDTIITIQIDFANADNFDMTYVDSDGEKKRPYIIHRSSIGSYERTLAMLIEKYAGAFPLWLSPTQVKVLTLSDRAEREAQKIVKSLIVKGVRAEADLRNEKIGYKIREAQLDKVPYMLIIGDKEVENKAVSVRSRREGDIGQMKLADFLKKIIKEIEDKAK